MILIFDKISTLKMQFKHPEILYFLTLLLIPILVHLFQLRRFKKEYFTNVSILKQLSIQTRKSSKLKKWLLLATRLLLLAFIIFAFAQPYFKGKDSISNNNELYIIVDNSFSMQAKGQKGELLKRAVQDLLGNVPENQTFSLVTCSENFWNTDIKSIQNELQNLQYSSNEFQLDNLLSKINTRKSAFNKDVFVITDGIGLRQNQLTSIKNKKNITFFTPKAELKDNVSVDSVFINQILDNFYEISVKMTCFADDPTPTPIALYNNKKLIAKTIIKFESKSKIQNFTIPKADFNGYVSIVDNSLDYDNTLYFNISKPTKINVISIGESVKSDFLNRIYTAQEFNYKNFELQSLDYNLLEKQDAIILNEISEIPDALQVTLKNFVDKGGNLIVIPALEMKLQNMNAFLATVGNFQYLQTETVEKQVTKIAFDHPLYKGVFEKKTNNFQYPKTKNSYQISNNNPVILAYADQSAFLTNIQKQLSNVYVFSASINKENSNFQNSPLIVPTFYQMAQNRKSTGVTSIQIGRNEPFILDFNLSKDEILTIKNENEQFVPLQQNLNSKTQLTFNDMPTSDGNFGIYNKNTFVKDISFNYPRTESNLNDFDSNALSDFSIAASIETYFDNLQTNRADNQLWKWFAIFALLFLTLEVLIQKFVK